MTFFFSQTSLQRFTLSQPKGYDVLIKDMVVFLLSDVQTLEYDAFVISQHRAAVRKSLATPSTWKPS